MKSNHVWVLSVMAVGMMALVNPKADAVIDITNDNLPKFHHAPNAAKAQPPTNELANHQVASQNLSTQTTPAQLTVNQGLSTQTTTVNTPSTQTATVQATASQNLPTPSALSNTPPIGATQPSQNSAKPAVANPVAFKPISTPLSVNQLPEGFAEKIAQAHLSTDQVSLIVQPLNGKPTLVNVNANIPRTPASTQKLIPTFIALDSLGKDFRWQTQLWIHGVVVGDTLHGDVIIKGSGAPKLEDDQLAALIGNLALRGIHHIDGNVIVDNSVFENVSFDVNAFDKQGLRPYNAMPNGLLINFGTLTVKLSPDNTSGQNLTKHTPITAVPTAVTTAITKALEKTTPITDNNAVQNDSANSNESSQANQQNLANLTNFNKFNVTLTPNLADFDKPSQTPATQASCRGVTEEKLVSLTPNQLKFAIPPSANCGIEQTYWLTYPNADMMAIKAVSAHIHQQIKDFHGQVVLAKNNSTAPNFWHQLSLPTLVAVAKSAPLSEQINDINHYSNNVMTEQLALSLPLYAKGEAVSNYPKTFDFIQNWWHTHLPKYTAPIMTRASGLCRDCQVKPSSLLAVLTTAYHHPDFAVYQDSLPLAGVSGTMKALKKRQPTNPAIGRAWIKTGTLDNVTSMAGYVHGQSGKWYAVVAMINAPNVKDNYPAKTMLDDFLWWTASQ